MDRFCLQIICASTLLLVTAFALGTPGLKSEGPPEKTVLLRGATRWGGEAGIRCCRLLGNASFLGTKT